MAQQTPAGPAAAYRGRLLGVYDAENGNPVEGVRVSDVLSGTSAMTTATGTVSLVFMPDGGGLVRLQRIGYQTQTTFVSITPRDTTPVTLTMQRVTQLPTVVTTDSAPHYVSPALRGFLERSKREAGYFLDEAVLRKNENRSLANVMRARMPGAQFHEGNNGSVFLLKSPRCIEGGPPQVYLDGVPISPDSVPQLRAGSRGGAAIAKHSAVRSEPVFGGGARCGGMVPRRRGVADRVLPHLAAVRCAAALDAGAVDLSVFAEIRLFTLAQI